MASMTDQFVTNNQQYAGGQALHKPSYPGRQPIQPARLLAVVACMDARLVEGGLEGEPRG